MLRGSPPRHLRVLAGWATCAAAMLLVVPGCSSSQDEDDEDEEEISATDASAVLELRPLDIWAQTLPTADIKLNVTRNGRKVAATVAPTVKIYLRDPGRYTISLAAPMHEPAEVALDFDGTANPAGLKLATPAAPRGTGVSVSHIARDVPG